MLLAWGHTAISPSALVSVSVLRTLLHLFCSSAGTVSQKPQTHFLGVTSVPRTRFLSQPTSALLLRPCLGFIPGLGSKFSQPWVPLAPRQLDTFSNCQSATTSPPAPSLCPMLSKTTESILLTFGPGTEPNWNLRPYNVVALKLNSPQWSICSKITQLANNMQRLEKAGHI